MATTRIPVLIAGGGPVGLGLALDLGRRGVPCLLVEQGDGERVQPKMLTVSVRTMELCRRWGVDGRVRDWGFPEDFPLDNVFVTSLAGHEIARLPKPAPRDIRPMAVSPEAERHCPQTWFDPILRDAAAACPAVTVRHQVRLEAFTEGRDGVEALLTDRRTGARETVQADYLIGCDGYRSLVRDTLGIAMRGRDPVDRSVNLMVRIPNLRTHHDKGDAGRYVLVGEAGTWATFVAIDGRDLWRITLYGSAQFDPYAADYDDCIRRCLGRAIPYELVHVERWTRRGMVADCYGRGRVWLAGDAVHAMPPNGGFGMNTGMADAADLGWKLAAVHDGWGGAGLLDTYDLERRPVGGRAVAEALRDYDRLTANTGFPGIAEDTAQGAETRRGLGERLEAANRRAWEPVGIHLGYRYDASPIVIADGTPAPADDEMDYLPTARPGSRAPHVWLDGGPVGGQSTLDLFGAGFTLLCFDADRAAVDRLSQAARVRGVPLNVVQVRDPAAARAFERPLVLVRPDGHVAWRGAALDREPIDIIDKITGRRMTLPRVP